MFAQVLQVQQFLYMHCIFDLLTKDINFQKHQIQFRIYLLNFVAILAYNFKLFVFDLLKLENLFIPGRSLEPRPSPNGKFDH